MSFNTPVAKRVFSVLAILIMMVSIFPQSSTVDAQGPFSAYMPLVAMTNSTSIDPGTMPTPTPMPTQPPPIPVPTGGKSFYVTPNGSSGGDGSEAHPWNIQTALNQPSAVHPGDTIWLRAGTYGSGGSTRFTSNLSGTKDKPILLRGYPGERARVNGGILAKGQYTWFWGFEIYNSSSQRVISGSLRPPGLYMLGLGQKAINLIVHDTGHPGIGFWKEVGDGGEVYGCIIWGVGTFDTDKASWTDGRGSAIYAQNQNGTHLIKDVISFRNLTTGMKAYAEGGYVNGFTFEQNVTFETGDRLIFASGSSFPVHGLKVINNYTYRSPSESLPPVRLGYADVDQYDAVVTGNWFVNGTSPDGAFYDKRFRSMTVKNNVFVTSNKSVTWLKPSASPSYTWDNNKYYGGSSSSAFNIDGSSYSFNSWKSKTGFDANSTFTSSRPTGVNAFVHANQYDPDRAYVVIYNWDKTNSVSVNLSSFLQPGDNYKIVDVQNLFGSPVVTGTYSGGSVSIPMNLTAVSQIIGDLKIVPTSHTSTEFGTYMIYKLP